MKTIRSKQLEAGYQDNFKRVTPVKINILLLISLLAFPFLKVFSQAQQFTGDFDGDGKWDIGLFNPNGNGNWFIRYNDGAGSFGRQTVFTWGPFSHNHPFTGDFNGDGKWDIGSFNPNGNGDWFIKYGDGSGSFGGQTAFNWGPFSHNLPFTGDFNGDGKWDIGSFNPNGNGDWFIWYGDGAGSFSGQTAFNWGPFSHDFPFTGDFNRDGKWDIGSFNPNGNGDWFIKYGDGSGSFGGQTAFNWGPFSHNFLFTGDFNGDKKYDIGFYNPNSLYNWYIKYGEGVGSFASQSVWEGGNPKTSWNPCCSNGNFALTSNAGAFFEKANSTSDLRKAMCLKESDPKDAPNYTGDSLAAFKNISMQLYPGSDGNIRTFYNSINISWGALPTPIYDSTTCNCGGEGVFDGVNEQLQREIQAVADIGTLFTSLSTYYINPLFIAKGNSVASVVTNVNLPANVNATISTGEIIEKTIFSFVNSAFQKNIGAVNPYAPMLLSALLNLSRTSNGGNIKDKLDVEIANIETTLAKTFTETLNQIDTLRDLIMSDYSVYMKLGRHSSSLTEGQLSELVISSAKAYERQLYTDLMPLACRVVFYDPGDTHLGGGGHAYGPPSTNYAKPSAAANQIVYKHNAGFFWNSSSYFTTNTQLLTSYVTFNDGDGITGTLEANKGLSVPMYKAIFDTHGFTYDEILALPGMITYYQCSLCQADDGCNGQCRSASSRGD